MTSSPEKSAAEPALPLPVLTTTRLQMRGLSPQDAARIAVLANEKEIHANTRSFPFPYTEQDAIDWLGQVEGSWEKGEAAVFAMETRPGGELIGTIGLHICSVNHHAELGYWLGKPYWGQGYCSEAAIAVVAFGFEVAGLHRIHGHYLTRNPASGKVMQNAGMQKEGLLRSHVRKLGQFEDIQFYGALRSEWKRPEHS